MKKSGKGLTRLLGTPRNLSASSGGRTTQAEKRPAVNSNITNNKWGDQPSSWGRGVGK